MKLVMEDDTVESDAQLFEANVLLLEAWRYTDGNASIVIDAMHNTRDANDKLQLGKSAVFRLSGTKEELQEFVTNLQEALDDAPIVEVQ